MLKRFLQLSLTTKRNFPVITCRYLSRGKSSPDRTQYATDISEDFETFPKTKKSTKGISPPKISEIVPLFTEILECDENEADNIAEQQLSKLQSLTLPELRKQLETFIENGFDRKVLLQYPDLLTMEPAVLNRKLAILKRIPAGENGKGLTDYLPLMQLDVKDLEIIQQKLSREESIMPTGTRIHFLSKKLQVEPCVISQMFVDYPFMRTLSKFFLFENVDLFLQYKIPAHKILRCPWAFKYNPARTEKRLEAALKIKGEGNLTPWLVHAHEKNFKKSLVCSTENNEPLKAAGVEDHIGYLSTRLGCTRDQMKVYLARYPAAEKVTIRKLKKILDYLLDEAGYSQAKVADMPRLYTLSLETIKKRDEELKKYNYNVGSLFVLCQPNKSWEKFINRVKENRHYSRRKEYEWDDEE
ncbi:uncharacterized protein LOC134836648 [Culicoides brevitarsis]|uniref:uncharacterized protein LOC134836648 n=1 Tax=Culicoides brevitarsis TaxID=469753 RepID=UPI00307B6518